MLPLILWLLIIEALGLLAFPIAFSLFRSLPDHGYAFAKTLGLLLGTYIFWLLVTLDILPNTPPALIVGLVPLVLLALLAARRQWSALMDLFRREKTTLWTTELVFLLAFLLFAGFRSMAPDIHLTTELTVTTEQPMDLAFLTSTMRSPSYPPQDPWFSGSPISYYYLGYLAVGWLGRLALATPPTAYNLGLVTLFALTVSGAFGIVSNAVRFSLGPDQPARRVALYAGAAGAAFVALWGNLVAPLDLLRGWGLGSAAFWQWIDIPGMRTPVPQRSLLPPGDSWWWHSSRVIVDGTGANPINEFPSFSFILGDLHPHVMALPFVLLAVGLALAVFAREDAPGRSWPLARPGEFLLVGIILGALGFVNSWDLPTYAGLFGAALLLSHILRSKAGVTRKLLDTTVVAGSSLLLAILLYLPFYTGLDTQVRGILPLASTGTRPLHYLLLWGPFLALVGPFAAAAALAHRWPMPSWGFRLALLLSLGPLAFWTTVEIALGLLTGQTLAALLATAQRWALVLPLATLIFLAFTGLFRLGGAKGSRGWAFGLLLGAGGLLLVTMPELFFVLDLFGTRMNTVFKLHYQAWVLLGLSGALGMAWLIFVWRPQGLYWSRTRGLWIAAAAALALGGAVFPALAPITRMATSPSGPTLDGLAFYRERLPQEVEAIAWLTRHAPTDAVVLEAQGDDYTGAARVSAITGLPTVLGWLGHEHQWGRDYGSLLARRKDVDRIYSSDDLEEVQALLTKYTVAYVYIGNLERQRYGDQVAARMGNLLPVIFQSGPVAIFRAPQSGG